MDGSLTCRDYERQKWNFSFDAGRVESQSMIQPIRAASRPLAGATVEIPQARYQADLELHDRYIGFSSELLRLAVTGIGAVGFLIAALIHNGQLPPPLRSPWFVWPGLAALICLAFAAAFALAHRYFASDGMYHHLRAIKLLILIEANGHQTEEQIALTGAASSDESIRNRAFNRSGWLLLLSAVLLGAGISAVGVGAAGLLLVPAPAGS